jgi:putative membrane protein
MLLKQNLRLYRIFKITWKIDILILLMCTAAYFIDTLLMPEVHLVPALATLMGTAIAFFIAFNNNQAYSRWWEARIIWGGIVNDSRSWTRNLLAYADAPATEARRMSLRHIGFLYALKASLRNMKDDVYKNYLPEEEWEKVEGVANIPNAILDLQSFDLQKLSKENKIDGFRFLALNDLVRSFCDGMGKSERINKTVFPTTYIYFTRLFIWILVVLTTTSISESVGPLSIFFGWLIGFVFYSTHENGMNLMNPFDLSPYCIPLNSITRTIEINVLVKKIYPILNRL